MSSLHRALAGAILASLLLGVHQCLGARSGIDTYRVVPGVGRYRLHVSPRTYEEAVQTCDNEEAHLAVPRDVRQQAVLVELLNASQWLLAFIGVNDLVAEGNMVTVLGEPWSEVGVTEWEVGEPNNAHGSEDCVIITRRSLLNDWNCSSSLGFICEKSAGPATPTPQGCAALRPGPGLEVECSRDGDVVSCAQPAQPGTLAIQACAPGFAHASGKKLFSSTCARSGAWSAALAQCEADCGRLPGESGRPFVAGGVEVTAGDAPWHVGVYKLKAQERGGGADKFEQHCGGTLVAANLVISAAHCFWSEQQHRALPATLFLVAAGKMARDLETDEATAQARAVVHVALPPRYTGSRNSFQQDIAVVRLATPLRLGGVVGVACFGWDRDQLPLLAPGDNGTVAGWGFDGVNKQSATLRSAQLAYVPFDACWKAFANRTSFRAFITADKMCAGWEGRATAVCPGDSGGGLVFPKATSAGRRFYLRGVVSVGPVAPGGGACSVDQLATFTDVTLHAAFLDAHVKR